MNRKAVLVARFEDHRSKHDYYNVIYDVEYTPYYIHPDCDNIILHSGNVVVIEECPGMEPTRWDVSDGVTISFWKIIKE